MNCLSVERISKRYGPRQLFENISFGLEKGQKTAIVARNGTGKSTLLKCIAGLETPDSGIISFNKGLRIGYLDQNVEMTASHSLVDEMLDRDDPVTNAIRTYEHAVAQNLDGDALHSAIEKMTELNAWDHEARVKRLLFQFGLRDLEQPVNTLSGGQQKRLGMAKVLIDMPDVLIMDEPTNHLDLHMIEQLEQELSAPNVTLLLVTHDRYFLDNVCDEIIEMEFGEFTRFKGNYSYYVEKKADAGRGARCHAAPPERLHAQRAGMGAQNAPRTRHQEQEPPTGLRHAEGPRQPQLRPRPGEHRHPELTPRRQSDRGPQPHQELRRQEDRGAFQLQPEGRRPHRHRGAERHRQEHVHRSAHQAVRAGCRQGHHRRYRGAQHLRPARPPAKGGPAHPRCGARHRRADPLEQRQVPHRRPTAGALPLRQGEAVPVRQHPQRRRKAPAAPLHRADEEPQRAGAG
ncbi:MAG: ATP-binding cassette domain-containing protein [Flavobacteriales bacterium]|nr:ATP-binding cassette domain-containing protein [Flavobacteriales bacterium]